MPDHYPDKKNKEKKVSPSKFLGRDEDGLGKVGGWGGGLFGGISKIGKNLRKKDKMMRERN